MAPTPIERVHEVAAAGESMPPEVDLLLPQGPDRPAPEPARLSALSMAGRWRWMARSIREQLERVLLRTRQEATALEVRGRTDAAVLVALYLQGGELRAVLTRRRDDLRRHPGEISFPGGRHDPTDADLLATALREAHEEIGLPPTRCRSWARSSRRRRSSPATRSTRSWA